MVQIRDKQVLIDGRPRVVMAGEIHYFRVPRDEWEQRILLLKDAGCDTVASYIPWLWHEVPDGRFDVAGETRPERDLAAFIDLCAEHGLWFIARPGPFIMAELKNEGVPYRLYSEHPEIVPVGWDGKPAPTRTLDYLAPAFLEETRRWFAAVLPLIADRLQPRGGNVIAVQLDNEIGMLAWVSNSPDLTEHLVADFGEWLRGCHGDVAPYPVTVEELRSPRAPWDAQFRRDLGWFMRDRFRRYVEALRGMCVDEGVDGVPFLINIHGTEGEGGHNFPIGISQLVDTYSGVPGMVSGSDHYMGDMSLTTTTDLYVMNAFMDAVHDADQPTTSLEFEAGTGDYGNGMDRQYDPSTVDLKTRLSVAQGNRMINYYLFAGGFNPRLDEPVGDGNDRISFTGERHGTAAPVTPEGEPGPTYAATAAVTHAVRVHEHWLARMVEDHDAVQLGLVLDAYATEYHHPDSEAMAETVEDLARHRGAGPRRALARSLLLAGFRFGAVHLERDEPSGVLVIGTSRHLSAEVQQRVVDHLEAGGRAVILGRLPEADLAGHPCTILADSMGVRAGAMRWDRHPDYYPSVVAQDWLAPWAEMRVGWLQELLHDGGEVLLRDVDGAVCGVDIEVGAGRAVLLSAELPSSGEIFERVLWQLGASPGLDLGSDVAGLVATTTSASNGERMLHVLNITGHVATCRPILDGAPLGDGSALVLPPRTGLMLALGLETALGRIEWANAELAEVSDDELVFHPGVGADGTTTVFLRGATPVVAEGATSQVDGDRLVVRGRGPVRLRRAHA